MGISARTEEVTPEKASRWLERAAPNRHIRDAIVMRHAIAMERGEWRESGEAVKFDADGELIDGQHRLKAVELSGVTVRMLVVRGLPHETMTVMDTGLRRTLADVLKLRGEVSTFDLAAALTTTLQLRSALETGKWPSNSGVATPTNDWALQLLAAEPGIREAVREGRRMILKHSNLKVYPKTWSTAYHHLTEIDEEDLVAFYDHLRTGANLGENTSIYQFRKRFQAGNVDAPRSSRDQLALLFKAWNIWRQGETVAQLRIRFGGSKPEPFPVPK